MSAENQGFMPLFDDSEAYLRSEVMAVTGATRGEIQGLLDAGVVQQGHPRDRTLYRWSHDEIVMLVVALRLTRMGVLMACVRRAIDAVRREHQAGELGSMVFRFDNAGRF